ncbi:uncharacterized protein LOC144284177 [Canis aureus]
MSPHQRPLLQDTFTLTNRICSNLISESGPSWVWQKHTQQQYPAQGSRCGLGQCPWEASGYAPGLSEDVRQPIKLKWGFLEEPPPGSECTFGGQAESRGGSRAAGRAPGDAQGEGLGSPPGVGQEPPRDPEVRSQRYPLWLHRREGPESLTRLARPPEHKEAGDRSGLRGLSALRRLRGKLSPPCGRASPSHVSWKVSKTFLSWSVWLRTFLRTIPFNHETGFRPTEAPGGKESPRFEDAAPRGPTRGARPEKCLRNECMSLPRLSHRRPPAVLCTPAVEPGLCVRTRHPPSRGLSALGTHHEAAGLAVRLADSEAPPPLISLWRGIQVTWLRAGTGIGSPPAPSVEWRSAAPREAWGRWPEGPRASRVCSRLWRTWRGRCGPKRVCTCSKSPGQMPGLPHHQP